MLAYFFSKGPVEILLNKGIELLKQDKYSDAVKCAAVLVDENNKKGWFYKGWCESQLLQYDNALQSYEKVTNNLKKSKEALECYDQAIFISPEAQFYDNKGDALKQLNKQQEALESYKEALKLNPNYIDSKNSIKEIKSQLKQKSEIKLQEEANKGELIQKLSQIEEQDITKQFITKLTENGASDWINKFTVLQGKQNPEIVSYCIYSFSWTNSYGSQAKKYFILLDFGTSKIKRINQDTEVIAMSYCYSAPEIKETDQSQISPKVDIFSFGIILYELKIQGRAWKNWIAQGPTTIYQLIRNKNLDFFKENKPTNNQQLDKLIRDCVQYDATKRPTAEEVLARIKYIKF